jgi:hypothetical protein
MTEEQSRSPWSFPGETPEEHAVDRCACLVRDPCGCLVDPCACYRTDARGCDTDCSCPDRSGVDLHTALL